MHARNILNEETQNQIYSLSKGTLVQAQKYLEKFRASAEYAQLINTKNSELSDEDAICLALTRKSVDTDKIDIVKLKNAILNVYIKTHGSAHVHTKKLFEMYKDEPASEIFQFCTAISMLDDDEDVHGLKTIAAVFVAINHSRNFFSKVSIRDIFLILRIDPQKGGYINLSRLNLENLDFSKISLNDALPKKNNH